MQSAAHLPGSTVAGLLTSFSVAEAEEFLIDRMCSRKAQDGEQKRPPCIAGIARSCPTAYAAAVVYLPVTASMLPSTPLVTQKQSQD